MWHYGFGFGFFPFFPFIWILFWILIVALFFRGWGRRHGHWYDHEHEDKSTEEILKQRFAHGEIDEKEYKERMRVLKETDNK